ncbi:hypothetical protein LAUMK13_05493 [Mycobacterium innocens]|uniref:Uncharacterized protein n=1 Tax=Mycobacterium innocens TaxID=2341083 RepID=A0A498QI32_9MYCO|nr:hypothetical protein LAUMK13_05493 [Mycobacterium innocens]
MPLRPHPRALDVGGQRLQQLGHVVVGDGHPLGDTGGARGVDEVSDILGARGRQAGVRVGVDAGILDIDDPQVEPVEPRPQARRGDRGDRGGIGEHEPDPGRRQNRVDGQVGRPGFQHRQHRHDPLRRPLHQQPHTRTRARTVAGQQVRQPVSRLLQLAVGHRAAPEADRHRLRGARDLRGKQRWNRHRRWCGLGQHRAVADGIQVDAFLLVEQVDR